MELESLSLQNFRQFRGSTIEFSRDSDQNVTVIHGDNGSGKTTLLNAFNWVLYGEVDFETGTDQLANEGAMAAAGSGESVEVSVTLTFYHDGTHYRATRSLTYQKTNPTDLAGDPGEPTVTLEYEDGGRYRTRNNPDTQLEQMIPERLRSLFFFDGEDIDELADTNNQERIQEAIQNIMGLTILERSIRHLDEVARRFRSELSDVGSDQLSNLLSEQEKIENQLNQKREQLQQKRNTEGKLESRIEEIGETLENLDESKDLEDELREAEKREEELRTERSETVAEIRSQLTKHGMLSFALPALRETAADLDELRANDLIGGGVSQEFIDKLLEREECICGRPLDHNSKYHERVSSIEPAVDAEGVNEHAIRVAGHLERAEEHYAELLSTLQTLLQEYRELDQEVDAQVERIDEIETKISSLDFTPGPGQESPAELQQERERKREEVKNIAKDIGRIEEQMEDLEAEQQEIEEKLGDARESKAEAERIRKRWKAAVETCHNLENSFEKLQQTVRQLANDTVSTRFDAIAHKDEEDLHAAINEEFELVGQKQVGDQFEQVEMSTGERQIASLTFIGSLISIARKRHEEHSDAQFFSGGIYPIVMDSPFGALDNEHRRHVSHEIPRLAKQIVVLVTDSQWEGPVADELGELAGAQYRLEYQEGDGEDDYPETEIVPERTPVISGGVR